MHNVVLHQLHTKRTRLEDARQRAAQDAEEAAREAALHALNAALDAETETAKAALQQTAHFEVCLALTDDLRIATQKAQAVCDSDVTPEECAAECKALQRVVERRRVAIEHLRNEPAFRALESMYILNNDEYSAMRWLRKWMDEMI